MKIEFRRLNLQTMKFETITAEVIEKGVNAYQVLINGVSRWIAPENVIREIK